LGPNCFKFCFILTRCSVDPGQFFRRPLWGLVFSSVNSPEPPFFFFFQIWTLFPFPSLFLFFFLFSFLGAFPSYFLSFLPSFIPFLFFPFLRSEMLSEIVCFFFFFARKQGSAVARGKTPAPSFSEFGCACSCFFLGGRFKKKNFHRGGSHSAAHGLNP